MALFSVALLASLLTAQGPLVIRGIVVDGSGNPLPDAHITLDATSKSPAAFSDLAGAFEITGLMPGSHVVRVSLPGFRTQTRTVTLAAGQTSQPLRFVLEIGTLVEAHTLEPDPRAALRFAIAIAYVRLEGLLPPLSCSELTLVSNVHSASVLETWKGKLPAKIQLLEPGVGSCIEDGKSVTALSGLSSRYAKGAELIVLLFGQGPRFSALGQGSFVFSVREETVATGGFLNLEPEMPLRQFERRLLELAR